MSDSMILSELVLIRRDLAGLKDDMGEVKVHLGRLERAVATLSVQVDRLVGGVGHIKRRLGVGNGP